MSRPVPDVPIAELNARTEHVKLLDVQVLSDNWYVLRKVTCSLRRRDGQWQTMSREAYDRGNGAALLLFDPRRGMVVLTRQFRLPAFLNGCADGLLIETCAGLLDGVARPVVTEPNGLKPRQDMLGAVTARRDHPVVNQGLGSEFVMVYRENKRQDHLAFMQEVSAREYRWFL